MANLRQRIAGFLGLMVFAILLLTTSGRLCGQGNDLLQPQTPSRTEPFGTTAHPQGKDILAGVPTHYGQDQSSPYHQPSYTPSTNPYGLDPSNPYSGNPGMNPMLLNGDPVALIPHLLGYANKHGILQGLVLILVVFIFQYVRNTQKNAEQREEFLRNQLDYADKRTTEELTRLSSKLGMMEQDFRASQERLDRHVELIRSNGQLSREIVSTMTAHNLAVEQGIKDVAAKLDALAETLRRKKFSRRAADQEHD